MKKAIFITGGASGIGRAIAQRFADGGWFVGLGDVDEQGMIETQHLIGLGFSFGHTFDVRDRAAWDEALNAFSMAAGGRIDVVANNAGIPLGGNLDQNSVEEIERCLDINLKGVLFGAQAALPHLKQTAPGSCLLNTASASAIYGSAGLSAYSATKFAVRGLTEALDAEWAPDAIKVRDLLPGFIDTNLLSIGLAGTNRTAREAVVDSGLEFTPVEVVAQAAWDAVHGDKLHSPVGKTARRLTFAARWMPGRLRRMMRSRVLLR